MALVARASRLVAGSVRTCGFSLGESQYFEWRLCPLEVFRGYLGVEVGTLLRSRFRTCGFSPGEKRFFDGAGWADARLGVALVGRASRRVAGSFRTCGFPKAGVNILNDGCVRWRCFGVASGSRLALCCGHMFVRVGFS